MPECSAIDPLCHIGELANSAFGGMVENLYDGAVELAKIIGTWWMEVPPPNLDSAGLNLLQQDLSWFVWVFAVIGFFLGLIRLVMTEDVRSSAVHLAKPIVNLVLATGVYMAAVPILLTAGDETAQWLLDRSTEGNSSMELLIPSTGAMASNYGVAFVLYLLMLLGAGVNFLFMVFRDLSLMVLMAFIAVLAAASGTESGNQAWRKANGWLIALLLFKPVAAGIYALGFRMMIDDTDLSKTSDLGAGMLSALTGLLILVLAAFALPGLIKFIVPAAAVGSSGFSGGAALSGAAGVAAGAAVLAGGMGAGAMAARGGAGALAASGAGTGAGAAGGSGSAPGGGGSGGGPGGLSSSGAGAAGGASSTTETTAGGAGASPSTSGAAVGGTSAGGAISAPAGASAAGSSPGGSAAGGSGSGASSSSSTSGSTSAAGASSASGAASGAEATTGDRADAGSAASGAPAAGGSAGTAAGGSSGSARWAEAINRYTQASQAGSQAAGGARVDRALDDEGDRA
jgi:type IV secretion system protein TrbL